MRRRRGMQVIPTLVRGNKVEYTGFVDQGFYRQIDSEKMDFMIKTYNRV
jgi:hypothetical protein